MEREVGGGIGMGNTCKPMAVSFQCMTKSTTNKKKKKTDGGNGCQGIPFCLLLFPLHLQNFVRFIEAEVAAEVLVLQTHKTSFSKVKAACIYLVFAFTIWPL